MDNNEYGIKLDLDLGNFEKSVKKAQNSLADLEKETKRKVKITGVEGLEEIEVKVNTEKAEKEFEKLASAKERIARGEIKITGLESPDLNYDEGAHLAAVRQLEADMARHKNIAPITNYDPELMAALDEVDKPKVEDEGLGQTADKLDAVGSAAQVAGGKIAIVGTVIKEVIKIAENSPLVKIINKIKQGIKQVGQNLKNSVKSVKRFALSLIGIQSAYRGVTKAISAYMSYDSDLQESLQQTWAGLGSFLAPVLEYVVGLFKQLLAYINAIVKAFTGIDFVARANAKALEKQAKAAQKVVAPFDEINNLAEEQKTNLIELPGVDIGSMGDLIEQIKQNVAEGDWYGLGELIGNKITEALNKINWSAIQNKASNIGKGIAEFINGGINGTDWRVVGNTIAQGINTAISFFYELATTLDWSGVGNAIGTTISTAIEKIDWAKFAQGLSAAIIGLINLISELIIAIDWGTVGESIAIALSNVDWSGVARAIAKGIGAVIGGIGALIAGAIKQFAIDARERFIESITDEKTGEMTAESILKGIASRFFSPLTWIRDNIVTPFVEGIWEAMGINNENGEAAIVGRLIGETMIWSWLNTLSFGLGFIAQYIQSQFNKLTGNEIIPSIEKDGKTIGERLVNAFAKAISKMSGLDLATQVRPALNGMIAEINKVIDRINSKLSISISDKLASILSVLGVKVNNGRYQLFSIPRVPSLSVGTDLVKEEGYAYLHAGEKVVPADVVSGGYTGADNTETNNLLRELIEAIESKDYKPRISVEDIGRANDKYSTNKARVMGGSF